MNDRYFIWTGGGPNSHGYAQTGDLCFDDLWVLAPGSEDIGGAIFRCIKCGKEFYWDFAAVKEASPHEVVDIILKRHHGTTR